ncbi:hypothetical protein [Nonomuraea sp. LPB2021202275-12-8]|uniref:hypothetical protein n=1 Tax=Nonomuraea sp. LPB2021202275-12-8 TaxID=3120159 RepID=UPI00300CB334
MRLLVVAIFALQISIIALASAASAATFTPDEEPREAPAPIVRVYHLGASYKAPRLYAALTEAATSLKEAFGAETRERPVEIRHAQLPEARAGEGERAKSRWKQSARPRAARQARQPLVDLRRALPRHATVHLSHTRAANWIKGAGLRWQSTGNCTNRRLHNCTSLDSVRTSTVAGLVDLKHRSQCPVTVTGGTEAGHAPGRFSHGAGYKIDISHNQCIDRYITKNHDRTGVRSDGAALYRSSAGTVFADESDHWDILFK